MRLLQPKLSCQVCGRPLTNIESRFLKRDGKVVFDSGGWKPLDAIEVISCDAGHEFEAIYEQREPWRRVLTDAGPKLMTDEPRSSKQAAA